MPASIFFKHALSHTIDTQSETMYTSPQLELCLNFAQEIHVSIRSSSDGQPTTTFQQEVTVDKRRSSHTASLRGFLLFTKADRTVRDLLGQVPELSPELRDQWEAIVESYIRNAAEGVWIGTLRVVVQVSLVRDIVYDKKKRRRPWP